jgi:hypothetical protein
VPENKTLPQALYALVAWARDLPEARRPRELLEAVEAAEDVDDDEALPSTAADVLDTLNNEAEESHKALERAAKDAWDLAVELETCGRPVNRPAFETLPEFLKQLSDRMEDAVVSGDVEKAFRTGEELGFERGRKYGFAAAEAPKERPATPRELVDWATGARRAS